MTSKIATSRIVEAQEPVSGDENEELLQRLAQLQNDVSRGRIDKARVAIQDIAACWPDSARVQYWARVLAPPPPPRPAAIPDPDPSSANVRG